MPLFPPPSTGTVAADVIWDAKGDLAGGTGANTAVKLTVGSNGTVLTADSGETTGMKWAAAGGSGSVATDTIWDAAGDIAVGTGADTAAKLTVGASGKVPTSNGTTLAYTFPPAWEFDYVEKTSNVSPTATVEASADLIVSGSAVTYDGSTAVVIEFFSGFVRPDTGGAGRSITLTLWDGSTDLGRLGQFVAPAAQTDTKACVLRRRLTPTAAAHTYHIKAFVSAGTGLVGGGAGGTGVTMPAYIRITKA